MICLRCLSIDDMAQTVACGFTKFMPHTFRALLAIALATLANARIMRSGSARLVPGAFPVRSARFAAALRSGSLRQEAARPQDDDPPGDPLPRNTLPPGVIEGGAGKQCITQPLCQNSVCKRFGTADDTDMTLIVAYASVLEYSSIASGTVVVVILLAPPTHLGRRSTEPSES